MDPAKMKVVDLRSELQALGLDTKGNKPALVERLKKALESKTGKVIPDTSILDTSFEDADEVATPKRAGPAARTRRSSSTRQVQTPAKPLVEEQPQPIEEERSDNSDEVEESSDMPQSNTENKPHAQNIQNVEEESNEMPVKEDVENEEHMQDEEDNKEDQEKMDDDQNDEKKDAEEGKDRDEQEKDHDEEKDSEEENDKDHKPRHRELTEEEEWEELNEKLIIKEKERLERERKQAEEDAKKFEEVADNPVKLLRLKRKQEKKARWSNYYRSIEVTNEVLAPLVEEEPKGGPRDAKGGKKDTATEAKIPEPELNDDKVTLSWYDSDLNQYLELPELNSVVPLTESVFAHAWAGTRASHGVVSGRVCYEVRIGSVVTTTETSEEKSINNGLRLGWSTEDSSLHLGESELSWGFESTGRAFNNGEFKDYGKSFTEKDVIGVYLDLQSRPCKISYTLNGVELGVAYEFDKSVLGDKPLFPHILTKNMCYKVNFGYDRYNMLTKTKIVRKRIELPVEQVLEEKRAREAEIQRQKQEAARKARERREREKKEREERMRKKREERERQEKEKKEKEKEKENQESKDEKQEEPMEAETQEEVKEPEVEQPKENGAEAAPVEVKTEPMETEQPPLPQTDSSANKDVKTEPDDDVMEVTEDDFLSGIVLDKRIKFVIRYQIDEELDGSEACLVPGYILIAQGDLVEGPRRPLTLAECEVILMVGMPGSGKTYWARQHAASHPEKRYNIMSTGALFDKMKVDCKPFRSSYEGKWDAMVTKGAKCVLKLLEMAQGRRRNFILDQTNVYPSAQRRKLKEFDGFRRVAVVIVTDEETYKERQKQREEADGKEVPDGAIMDMKANFGLPEKCNWVDEVIYPELDEEEAKKVVEAFHKEAKAAGVSREREKRDRSASRDGPPNKKARQSDKRFGGRDDRRPPRDFGRDRDEDRWGGGGGGRGGGGGMGGGRWGPAGGGMGPGGRAGGGGGGGRWGPPVQRERPQPPGRFDRGGWGGPPPRGNDFGSGGGGGRDRDGFRGGRGGPGGPGGPGGRNDRGPGGPGGMRGPGMGPMGGPMGGPGMGGPGMGGPPDTPNRFNRGGGGGGNRGGPPSGPPSDKRQGPPGGGDKPRGAGGNVGGGGNTGSWQRGGGPGAASGGAGAAGAASGGPGGNRGAIQPRGNQPVANTQQSRPPAAAGNQKDGQNQNQNQQNQNQQNQQGWNQWATGWGGWGNWNQNQAGWGNWGNWGNWGQPNANNAASGATSGTAGGNKSGQGNTQGAQQQWPANYTAQQWYQWQQWQQQQQGWPGYQQSNQQGGATAQDQQQAWAQYYQNYGGANAANTNSTDKK